MGGFFFEMRTLLGFLVLCSVGAIPVLSDSAVPFLSNSAGTMSHGGQAVPQSPAPQPHSHGKKLSPGDIGVSEAVNASLVPGSGDLNPICYLCPNATYAEYVLSTDPLVQKHLFKNGSCPDFGFAKFIRNDPVWRDAGLYRK